MKACNFCHGLLAPTGATLVCATCGARYVPANVPVKGK